MRGRMSEALPCLSAFPALLGLSPAHVTLDLWKVLAQLTCSRVDILGLRTGTEPPILLSPSRAFWRSPWSLD